MFVKATGLNVNHHKKVSSNMPVKKAEQEQKKGLTTSVDNKQDKDKTRLQKSRAYKVELSNQGRKKADAAEIEHLNNLNIDSEEELENFNTAKQEDIENELGIHEPTEEEKKTKTAEEEFNDRLHQILNVIKSGRTLTQKQEDWLNGELQAMAAKRFDMSKKLHLTREDQRIMEALGDNIKQRRRILQDLLQQVNSSETKNGFSLSEINNMMEQKELENELKIVQESLKDDAEDDTKEIEDKEKTEEEEGFTDEAEEVEDKPKTDPLKDEKRAAELIDQNISEIDAIKIQQQEEQLISKRSDKNIDVSYKYAKESFNSSDSSLEDKAAALEEFDGKAQRYAFEREAYRNMAEYDAETYMIARIILQQHDDLREVIKRNPYKVPVLDQDTVINLLQQ